MKGVAQASGFVESVSKSIKGQVFPHKVEVNVFATSYLLQFVWQTTPTSLAEAAVASSGNRGLSWLGKQWDWLLKSYDIP